MINFKNEMKSKNGLIIKLYYLIFLFVTKIILSKSDYKNYSYITLKMLKGENKVFSDSNEPFTGPSEIHINGIKQEIKPFHTFDANETTVILIWNEKITNCKFMFKDCSHIKEIDFTYFNASLVEDMQKMFYGCESLISLDLSNFDTSNVKYMEWIFYNCKSLTSIKIKNFNTMKVTAFNCMFYICNSLVSIDLSSFNTLNAINMGHMFYNCSSLSTLNLFNFNTSSVLYIDNMFKGSSSLTSLNFPNLDTSNITDSIYIENIFAKCFNLEYINIKNYKAKKFSLKLDYFKDTKKNLVICTENQDLITIIEKNECFNVNCLDNWYEFRKKINLENNKCIDNCTSTNYKYEYNFKCYEDCPNGSIRIEQDIKSEKMLIKNKYFCKPICDEETPFEIIAVQECVKNCPIANIINKSCILNYLNIKLNEKDIGNIQIMIEEENETRAYDIMLENLEKGFTSNDYNSLNLEKGNNEMIIYEKMKITLTTTKNQKNNSNINETKIDLRECGILLRKIYNISKDEVLFIKLIEVFHEGMKIPKIEYDIYSKLNSSNLVKLNLSFCRNNKINLFVPTILNEDIDKLNSSSGYYNDLCYTSISDFGTDIIPKDRKEEFINKNKTVCQEKCDFTDYDYNTYKAICSCEVKESSSSFAYININKTKLLENFINIKNIANFNLLVCHNVLFSKNGIIRNYGFYSLILIILFHSIIILLFYIKKLYNVIKVKIKDIIFGIKNFELIKKEKRKQIKKGKIKIKKYNLYKHNTKLNSIIEETNNPPNKKNIINFKNINRKNNSQINITSNIISSCNSKSIK